MASALSCTIGYPGPFSFKGLCAGVEFGKISVDLRHAGALCICQVGGPSGCFHGPVISYKINEGNGVLALALSRRLCEITSTNGDRPMAVSPSGLVHVERISERHLRYSITTAGMAVAADDLEARMCPQDREKTKTPASVKEAGGEMYSEGRFPMQVRGTCKDFLHVQPTHPTSAALTSFL